MKSAARLRRSLALVAFVIFAAGLGTWVATGRHLGWTQTSVVSQQHDEITGIDYPVRRDAFIAGVEIPAATTALAFTLAGLGWLLPRRQPARA